MADPSIITFYVVRDTAESFHSGSSPGHAELVSKDNGFHKLEDAEDTVSSFLLSALEGGWSTNRVSSMSLKSLRHEDFIGHPDVQELLFDATRPLKQQFKGIRPWMRVEFRERDIEIESVHEGEVHTRLGSYYRVQAVVKYDFRIHSQGASQTVSKMIDGVEYKAEIKSVPSLTEWAPMQIRVRADREIGGTDSVCTDLTVLFPMYIAKKTLTLR